MKKYIKPELVNEEVIIEDVIAASGEVNLFSSLFGKQDGDSEGEWAGWN